MTPDWQTADGVKPDERRAGQMALWRSET